MPDRSRWFYPAALAGAVLIFIALTAGTALTKRPYGDEVFSAGPALDLVTRGLTGLTVLEPTGDGIRVGKVMTGINSHLYQWMPYPFLIHAAWFKVFGCSILSLRAVSLLFGLLSLGACWSLVNRLTGKPGAALLSVFLLGVDYAFVFAAADGRPDMIAGSLSMAAMAAYFSLRKHNLTRAVLISQALQAAAVFCHPNAAIGLSGLVAGTLWLDWPRRRWIHVLVAALPYVVFAAGWGIYILQNPHDFMTQFGAAMEGRLNSGAIWTRLLNEIRLRYLESWFLPAYARGVSRLRILIPLIYLIGILGAFLNRKLRSEPGVRTALIMAGTSFLFMSLFEGHKNYYYMVHIMPLLVILFALWAHWLWRSGGFPSWIALGLTGALVLLQVSWGLFAIHQNAYRNVFLPAVHFMRQNGAPPARVFGSAEFAFALGFYGGFKDDTSLGYTTGERPEFIVVDSRNYKGAFAQYQTTAPYLYRYVTKLLSTEYRQVYSNPIYDIYRHR
jgi:hypothetical protein